MFVTTCLLLLPSLVLGCVSRDPIKEYTDERVMYEAPILVRGTDIEHRAPETGFEGKNEVIFQVSCVMRSGGATIPQNITLVHAVVITSCDSTQLELNKEYIISLAVENQTEFLFRISEPETNTVSAFPPTTEYLETVSTLCGLDEEVFGPPDGVDASEANCPAYTATTETCLTPPEPTTSSGVGLVLGSGAVLLAVVVQHLTLLV